MKTKLLITFLCITVGISAQTPISSFYSNGDSLYDVVDSGTPIDQSASGANMVWNFNNLVDIGDSYYLNSTPTPDETTDFPNTNNVILSVVTDNLGVTTTSKMFVKDLASVVSITGIRNDLLELKFTSNNATIGAFPMNYGYTNTDPVAGTYAYDTYSGTFSGNLVTTADAYGTLSRNLGGFLNSNVTRLKTVLTISLNYGIIPNVGTITQTTYSYYQNTIGNENLLFRTSTITAVVPLASINQTSTLMESYSATILGTETMTSLDNQLRVITNPVAETLQLQASGNVIIRSVAIVDSSGRIVLTKNNAERTIDVSQLQTGIYLAKIDTNQGIVTKRIIKE